MKAISFLLFVSCSLFALSAEEIIKKVEYNLQSDNSYSKVTMVVSTKRGERTMKMESWNQGNEKSFIKILYPKKDKGITFLKIDTTMWQYVPKIEKIIKIPSSMMMQSWMGSDFTNDDMAKESSIVDDYTPKLQNEDDLYYTLALIPKENAPVVWGKIEMKVEKKYFYPLEALYYDEDDIKQRTLVYSKVEEIDDRFFPTVMTLLPQEKKSNKTVVIIEDVDFNAPIEEERFSKNALKRYSR